MSFCLKFGSSCNIPFDNKAFFKEHIEWSQYENYIVGRPNEPWTIFGISTSSSQSQNHSTKKKIHKKHNHTVRNNDVK